MRKLNYKKNIPISVGEVCISDKQTNGYHFVFSNFSEARHLFISTFNYYMEDEYLKTTLSYINSIMDIRVVFNTYDKEKIAKLIETSLSKNPYVQLYYNPENHSKIISNGNELYVGSANYTGFSKNNYEVGVRISDLDAINAIEEHVFNNILEYKVVITDPIQPLITYFTMILREYRNMFDWVEWFFEKAKIEKGISENDLEDMDENFLMEIKNVFHEALGKLTSYIGNNKEKFKEDGITLMNLIDIIIKLIKDGYDINLGSSSMCCINLFYEDYINCLESYKEEFWIENIIEMKNECLNNERSIVLNIETIINMLLCLKIKWIKNFNGSYKQKFYLSDCKCVGWLQLPNNVLSAMDKLI